MKISETLFSESGEALGLVEQDSPAGLVTFRPAGEHPKLEQRQWRRLSDCRRDVLAYFGRPARQKK